MSEVTETPSTPAQTAPTADVTPPDAAGRQTLTNGTQAERRARAAAAIKNAAEARKAPPATAAETQQAATASADAPPVDQGAVAAPEPAAKPAPAPVQDEATKAALAKAQAAALKREREAYEAKQRLKEYESKLKALESENEKFKGMSELEILEARGKTYEDLTKDILEGKYKPKSAEQIALEKHDAEVRAMREKIEAMERKEQEAQLQVQRQQEQAYVAEQIKAAAEKFPLLAAVQWAPQKVVERFYEVTKQNGGTPPDLHDVLSEYEAAINADVEPIIASDAVFKAFLQKHKDRALSLLDVKQPSSTPQQAQQAQKRAPVDGGNSPAAIPSQKAAEPGTRKTPSKSTTASQRRAAALAALMSRRSG